MIAPIIRIAVAALLVVSGCTPAFCWGDEAHKIVALLAINILQSDSLPTLDKINGMLGPDDNRYGSSSLTDEALWADRYRDRNPEGRKITESWHDLALDYDNPNLAKACEHPEFEGLASQGPSPDCIVDKIEQFRKELADKSADPDERLLALKYLLHLVADLHQPLNVIARTDPETGKSDFGGQCIGIVVTKAAPVRLRSHWDTTLVEKALGKGADEAADHLERLATTANKRKWSTGSVADWANESYKVAKASIYAGVIDHPPEKTTYTFRERDGKPDPRCGGPSKLYKIDASYDERAKEIVKEQLAKAGVRLAKVLKDALK
ncbi:MAG TPA: S1/P1 nuclease [Pseudolabrys sp.]|nr:S1/P1 nuclease [Pseudolabrys sp.]